MSVTDELGADGKSCLGARSFVGVVRADGQIVKTSLRVFVRLEIWRVSPGVHTTYTETLFSPDPLAFPTPPPAPLTPVLQQSSICLVTSAAGSRSTTSLTVSTVLVMQVKDPEVNARVSVRCGMKNVSSGVVLVWPADVGLNEFGGFDGEELA
ncbi:hypothetical protein FRC07_011120, partial [Ceratobasidium sp. 392]